MAGFGSAIHLLKPLSICAAMDCRVKPGNDELEVVYRLPCAAEQGGRHMPANIRKRKCPA
jgi:hypothetical protein